MNDLGMKWKKRLFNYKGLMKLLTKKWIKKLLN